MSFNLRNDVLVDRSLLTSGPDARPIYVSASLMWRFQIRHVANMNMLLLHRNCRARYRRAFVPATDSPS